jgi:hypothetical protein
MTAWKIVDGTTGNPRNVRHLSCVNSTKPESDHAWKRIRWMIGSSKRNSPMLDILLYLILVAGYVGTGWFVRGVLRGDVG